MRGPPDIQDGRRAGVGTIPAGAGTTQAASLKSTETVPRAVVTDKLRSYGAAHRQVIPSIEHRSSKYLNNEAENSYIPTRERKRGMKGFRGVGTAQKLLSTFSRISPHFCPRRHLLSAPGYPTEMTNRFTIWHQITGTTLMATGA